MHAQRSLVVGLVTIEGWRDASGRDGGGLKRGREEAKEDGR